MAEWITKNPCVLKGDLGGDNKQNENQTSSSSRAKKTKTDGQRKEGNKKKLNSLQCRCVMMTQDDDV
jgi:hypothetical protein